MELVAESSCDASEERVHGEVPGQALDIGHGGLSGWHFQGPSLGSDIGRFILTTEIYQTTCVSICVGWDSCSLLQTLPSSHDKE